MKNTFKLRLFRPLKGLFTVLLMLVAFAGFAQIQTVTINLLDHNGNPITAENGTSVQYDHQTGLNTFGSGTTSGGTITMDLPTTGGSGVNYAFRLTFHGAMQIINVPDITANPVVNYQTTLVTVNMLDHSGSLEAGGTAKYYNSGQQTIGSPTTTNSATNPQIELLPANGNAYTFYMGYNGMLESNNAVVIGSGPTQSVNFQTTLVTVNLKNCGTSSYVSGGIAKYYNGGPTTIGSPTTTSSATNPHIELLSANGTAYTFYMTYGSTTKSNNAITIPGGGGTYNVDFDNCVAVTMHLLDHNGNPITDGSGTAGYYSTGWVSNGATNGSGNSTVSLAPGSYYFNMNYNNYTQQVGAISISGISADVYFQTSLVTVNLKNHLGAAISDLSGTAGYYSNTWHTMGSTDINGNATVELLPGSYYFNMNYNHYTQQVGALAVTGGTHGVNPWTQTVPFQTTQVSLNLNDHTGSPITSTSGTGGYYTNSWYSLGSTGGAGSVSVELLPGSYYFNMNYNHYTQQVGALSVGSGPTQPVNFQTTLVTTSLKDHNGNGLVGGTAGYYTDTWHSIAGTTDATGTNLQIELLQGSYYFNMNYNHYTQQVGTLAVGAGPLQCVPFQTTTVSVNLKDCSASPSTIINTSAATANYYSNGWYSMGTVNAGTVSTELLPGSYYFNMSYNNGTEQLGTLAVTGATYPVDFNTTKVTFSNPANSPISYYQTGWHTFTPNSMNLLPGLYYFQVNGGATISKSISSCTQNFSIAPCGSLAITTPNDGGCGGSFPLSAPAGGSAYAWSGPSGFSANTRTIEPKVAGLYSVNVTYDFTCAGAAGGVSGYSYTVSGTPTANTVTMRLQDSKGNGIAGASVQYYNGSWLTFGAGTTNSDGFACMSYGSAGTYYFRVLYAGGTYQFPSSYAVASNPVLIAQTTCTTVRLINSSSNLISTPTGAGSSVQYYSGSWFNVGDGTTDNTGTTSIELLQGSYAFHLTYAHANEQLPSSVTIGAGPNQNVDFNTTAVSASLKDHNSNGIASGVAQYYSGGWYPIGTTGSNGITPSIELLPLSYPFNMTYNSATYQTPTSVAVSGTTTNVPFATSTVTASLKANGGAGSGLTGGVAEFYSSGSWHSVGTTDGSGNTTTSTEMLPGSYPFHMIYNFATYQTPASVAVSGAATNVPFTTSTVTASLKANGGAGGGDNGGIAEFYSSGGWHSVGTTDGSGNTTTSTEMLPGSYPFHMIYNFATYQTPSSVAVSGSATNVPFTTTTVTASLIDHTGSGTIDGGIAQFYSGGWHPIGTTAGGTTSTELLPGSYPFNMTYNFGTQQISYSVSGATSSAPFQTAGVVIHFQGNTGTAHSGATIGYYSNGWHNMALPTDANGNSAQMEVLPVQYYYNATLAGYGTTQVGPFTDAAGSDGTLHINGATTGYHVIQSSLAARYAAPIAATAGTTEFGVYPNPATDKITVKFNSTTDRQATINVTDMSGKVILNQVIESPKGTNTHDIELGNLPSGIYLLMFDNGDNNEVRKINVMH